MEYTTLGDTGLAVSRICLGCMSFGTGKYGWGLDGAESTAIIEEAIDLGVNFFDTANTYSWGESERILGETVEEHDRDRFVVGTKVYVQMDEDDPNSGGLSRKAIEQELENSLDRLEMETVDLYTTHRWDDDTPIETTLRALDDAVRRGRVRYLGASSMWTHQFADALHASDRLGLERFATMQNHYNLVYREEEREMLPFCAEEGIGVTPWSPLAKGYLARPHDEFDTTDRATQDDYVDRHPYQAGGGEQINERVEELAAEKDVTMAQIALAWLLDSDHVDAPVVGTTSVEHLREAVEALEIDLSESDTEWLEEPYEPVPVSGHE
jgi:aryl-alcohol dehydrogenase-like predicted oxidoreductase